MYKIEIWQNQHIIKTFESEDILDALNWYKSNKVVIDWITCND